MGDEIIRRRLLVHGFVQGVFFRDSTRECARRHGVAGWVRNRPDGTVEAVLEGTAEAVGAVADFCARGPDAADVNEVESVDEPPAGLSGFVVR